MTVGASAPGATQAHIQSAETAKMKGTFGIYLTKVGKLLYLTRIVFGRKQAKQTDIF